jgi:hypothetical protein
MIALVGLLGGRLAKRQAFAQRSDGGGVTVLTAYSVLADD